MKILKTAIISVLALYGIVLIIAFAIQNKLTFFPQKLAHNYQYNLSANDKEVFFPAADGKIINGILYHRPGNRYVVLYFHGNGGSLDSWQNVSSDILTMNCDLFIIDYRGYGKNDGPYSEQGFYDDALGAYKFLLQSGYSPAQIIAYGRSLGTGVATQLAVNQKVKALILESPYTSLGDVAAAKMPYLLPKLLLRYKLNTLQRAGKLQVPALLIHGTSDELIPYSQSQEIYTKIISPKKLLLIAGGGHNLSSFPARNEGVKAFIDSLPK